MAQDCSHSSPLYRHCTFLVVSMVIPLNCSGLDLLPRTITHCTKPLIYDEQTTGTAVAVLLTNTLCRFDSACFRACWLSSLRKWGDHGWSIQVWSFRRRMFFSWWFPRRNFGICCIHVQTPLKGAKTTNLKIGHEDAPSPAVNVCKLWWEMAMYNCDVLRTVAAWLLLFSRQFSSRIIFCLEPGDRVGKTKLLTPTGRRHWQHQMPNTHCVHYHAMSNSCCGRWQRLATSENCWLSLL